MHGQRPALRRAFEIAFEALYPGVLPREFCLDQLPKRIAMGARQFECKYLLIADGEDLEGRLTVVNDVTEQVMMALIACESSAARSAWRARRELGRAGS
jgi:hypothetical protein